MIDAAFAVRAPAVVHEEEAAIHFINREDRIHVEELMDARSDALVRANVGGVVCLYKDDARTEVAGYEPYGLHAKAFAS